MNQPTEPTQRTPDESRAYWEGYWSCQRALDNVISVERGRDQEVSKLITLIAPPDEEREHFAAHWSHYLAGWQRAVQEASDQ